MNFLSSNYPNQCQTTQIIVFIAAIIFPAVCPTIETTIFIKIERKINLIVICFNRTTSQSSFINLGTKAWVNLPQSLKTIDSAVKFKFKLKKHFCSQQ